jgi:hypothetical protein
MGYARQNSRIDVCLTFLAFRVESYMHFWEMLAAELRG